MEQAARARAVMGLQFNVDRASLSVAARLLELRPESMSLLLAGPLGEGVVKSAYFDASMDHQGQRYLFAGTVLELSEGLDGCRLEANRPKVLHMLQRRRFVRAELAESATVLITSAGGSTDQCTGQLLNLSLRGLACRIATTDADNLAIDQLIQLRLPAAESAELAIRGIVRSKTPAATRDAVIVGIEFHHCADQPDQQQALRGILARCGQITRATDTTDAVGVH
jgi:c-di-GMP-binding flagellar brake protein YcgR